MPLATLLVCTCIFVAGAVLSISCCCLWCSKRQSVTGVTLPWAIVADHLNARPDLVPLCFIRIRTCPGIEGIKVSWPGFMGTSCKSATIEIYQPCSPCSWTCNVHGWSY